MTRIDGQQDVGVPLPVGQVKDLADPAYFETVVAPRHSVNNEPETLPMGVPPPEMTQRSDSG